MNERAIHVSNISKKFKIYASPKDRIREALSLKKRRYHKEFWALRGISFSLNRGTTMGILGINGSGKSTLLKIICGYLLPTSGGVRAEGRISSILELGTGFNRDFTGRENVVLYGGLMGLSKELIMEKMPQVEGFTDIGDFFDRPMRLYSSGMYARLAFACAINTDPDILVIDEALAVGDTAFQHKCMHRIKQIQEQGVTILFVSHNISAVKSLCQEAILLERGNIITSGKAEDVANHYYGLLALREQKNSVAKAKQKKTDTTPSSGSAGAAGEKTEEESPAAAPSNDAVRIGTGEVTIDEVVVLDEDGFAVKSVGFNEEVCVSVRMTAHAECHPAVVGFLVRDYYGIDLLGTNTAVEGMRLPAMREGERCVVDFHIRLPLLKGSYSITVAVADDADKPIFYEWRDHSCVFEMLPPDDRKIVNCKLHLPIKIDISKIT